MNSGNGLQGRCLTVFNVHLEHLALGQSLMDDSAHSLTKEAQTETEGGAACAPVTRISPLAGCLGLDPVLGGHCRVRRNDHFQCLIELND